MLIYSILIFVITLIYHLNANFNEDSIVGMHIEVIPKAEDPSGARIPSFRPSDLSYGTRSPTYWPSTPSIFTKAFPLTNSNCFCLYDHLINLLLCSPLLKNSPSFPLSSTNISLINVTLSDCIFSNNHLNLPTIRGKVIDHLWLYDVNLQDYLVFDKTSFSSSTINHLHILYSSTEQITMLLISNDAFPSSISTVHFDSCYLIALNQPLNRLFMLESITLLNIQQFSWYDIQQQIIRLPKLRYVYIGEEILSTSNKIFNVISCQDLSSQWIFSYRSLQTCSCKLMSFLRTIYRWKNFYKCPNSSNTIDIIDDVCQFNGQEYRIQNQTDLFCNKCLSYQCPNGTLCAEVSDSAPVCGLLSRYDYETIRSRVPLTSYTKPFLLQESQNYLAMQPNKTLEPTGFNSIATILIDSNQNHTENSLSDAQMFHQTFSEMLSRPWSPAVYNSPTASPAVWQQLLASLDESIKNINDSDSEFEFQSPYISTMSLRFPSEQPPQQILSWLITNNNQITTNITNFQAYDKNITSRVFLKIDNNQSICDTSNSKGNCTNRFSITSIKSQKLFYSTDRLPEYDVISITAPSDKQHVTFYFDQKITSTDTTEDSINSTSDSFYDQLDVMVSVGTCMYLNTTSMIWQIDGCSTDRQLSNSTSVTCTCEHLTMFTVFFSLSCAAPSKALEIFSWIGCALSTIGLSITLIMFIIISHCRQTNNSNNGISSSHSSSSQELRRRIMSKPRRLSIVKSMLFILCILLILMNLLIFILTFIKSGRNLTCTIFSALLYYLTLTSFLWKFFFALQQSLFITNIFQPYWSDRTLFLIYVILTFSLPVCPLLIMFIKYEDLTFISSTCNYCWLSREFLLYGLIIPILVIICLNIIFYLYTMIHLCIRNRQQPGLRSTKSDHSRHMQNFKIGLFFAIIMGFSWILGFLVLIPNSYLQLIGNILFCIVNSLQGFAFSVMVFCMLERKSFRKCCCFWRYKTRQMKPTSNSTCINPVQTIPISNDDNDNKMKTIYNSSIYTLSTTSSNENNNTHDTLNHFRKRNLSTEKEEDEDEEHIYSTPIF